MKSELESSRPIIAGEGKALDSANGWIKGISQIMTLLPNADASKQKIHCHFVKTRQPMKTSKDEICVLTLQCRSCSETLENMDKFDFSRRKHSGLVFCPLQKEEFSDHFSSLTKVQSFFVQVI
ncbi:MAG: hypothetical protein IPK04_02395 [Bdellovibrionales bacterium]|nr:hypothetical protein [Bdellovibrionales bacterium]